ncbi:uncharacterized protein B0J16DRAFT_198608 [Fusarium flagelliforme]|uniref:Uncharacterized protein n=1 Tax=Fusarium equiseti TaxID=61235 RepID=A0A8J2IE59_FUSEQ|nr:uncharacterized protein B0J16DRAFT_198608 [Fusarium flagelliforme]KAH7173880.1 hypothetical protein B0J16DRAFT_198608 [Fusarium flagelliforme]CAG7555285.1 unnamed protein product [Fusarium equiseti]
MSRNIKRKFSTPVKVKTANRRRRVSDTPSTSSLDLSDDGGYSAVEDISDSSDDDEEDVAAAEESNILEEALPPTPQPAPRPQPTIEEDDDDEEEENDDDDEQEGLDIEDDDAGSWGGIVSDVEEEPADVYQDANIFGSDNPVERHVHFDVPSSDSDDTDTDDEIQGFFPDIFVSQNTLDPSFRREIENDPDESSGSGSFWDFNNQYEEQDQESDAEEIFRQLDNDTPFATPMASQQATAASTPVPLFEEPTELDGYETDGDTTEEDEPEPVVRRKTRRPSNPMSDASDSDADSPVKAERGQPRLGRYNLDRSDKKPIAVLNPVTGKMMIFTPHRRHQLDLSPEQFNFPWTTEGPESPIMSNSANLMLSAMFSSNTFGDFFNTGQVMGPQEAFYPFPSEPNTGDESSTAPSLPDDEDEEDDELNLDLNDFIAWEENDSSGEEDNGENWDPASTPARPSTATSDKEVLGHLRPENVGAFRRNQINQQLILSNQATQDSLAFSGPYNYTAIRGLKSDRFDTAAIPLTPARRHKRQMSDTTRSPLEQMSSKRKATTEAGNSHKRHRSISDVNYLQI